MHEEIEAPTLDVYITEIVREEREPIILLEEP
jgi:hypothetical protein